VARAERPARGFGVGLDDDPRAGVFLLLPKTKHVQKHATGPPRRRDRGVPELVDHQPQYPGSGAGWVGSKPL